MSQEEPTLSKNYSIPKKGAESMQDYQQQSILANSYFNIDYYNNSSWESQQTSSNPYILQPYQNPITHNIISALSTIKEKPKGEKKDIFKETVPDIKDNTLPKELTMMFQPLFCKLCVVQLSSNVMAKLHYKSKNHEKKIRKFLIEYSERTGEPLHKRAKMSGTPKTDEEKDPKWFYCEVCNLPLTGKMHAESHYMGKNHQKALMGYKHQKWQVHETPNFEETPRETPPQSKFHCEICNISTTCQEQLDMHIKGQKHKKKLKQHGLASTNPEQVAESMANNNIDLSSYTTPSGSFYCPTCNLSLTCVSQFKMHLKSKNHAKNSLKN